MKSNSEKTKNRIYKMTFEKVYPFYILKAEKKGRTKKEVDEIICWLTGYNKKQLESQIKRQVNLETFIKEAPKLNPKRNLITGIICGIRVEDIKDPIVKQIRYLDKLVDELSKGKTMEKILRNKVRQP